MTNRNNQGSNNDNYSGLSPEDHHEGLRNIVFLVVLILILFGLYLLFFGSSNDANHEVTIVSQEKVLENFPSGLPIESGIEADESYIFVPAGSKENQSTISYVSSQSFQENSSAFLSFLENEDYDILNETDEPGLRFFYAQKDDSDLLISIEEKGEEVLVNISFLQKQI